MITKIFHKKVYFVLLFCIFICGFYFNSLIVNADTNPNECSAESIYSRVNPSFTIDETKVTININGPSNSKINLGSEPFKLVQVYAYRASDNNTPSVSGDGANDGSTIPDALIPNKIVTKINQGYYKYRNLYVMSTINNEVSGYGSKFKGSLSNKAGSSIDVDLKSILDDIGNVDKTAFRFIFKRAADNNGGSCKNEVYFYVDIDGLKKVPYEEEVSVEGLADDGEYFSAIDCAKYEGDNSSFEGRFCWIKQTYLANQNFVNGIDSSYYDLEKNPNLLNNIYDEKTGTGGLKCNSAVMIEQNDEELNSETYYRNVQYFYGYKDESKDIDLYYQYHYDSVSEPVTEKISCSKKCEEVVEVKYGPPIASKAGLCIQYKVKVISRVACSTSGEVKKPRDTGLKVYSPVPYCISGGAVYNQGGPSSSFDKCIDNCDGGKYSLSCSKKCLKEVYASSNKTANDSANSSVASKLAISDEDKENCANRTVNDVCNSSDYNFSEDQKNECRAYFKDKMNLDPEDNVNGYGCYYRNDNSIGWYGLKTTSVANNYPNRYLYVDGMVNFGRWQNANEYVAGRWYIMQGLGGWGLGGYYYKVWNNGGIYRASYGGYACGDYCYWGSLPSDTYINRDYVNADYIYNKNTFEKAKKACSSQVTCSTKESEYIISAKTYKKVNGSLEVKNYVFPVGSEINKDTINNGDKLNSTDAGNKYKTDGSYSKYNTTLISDVNDIRDETYNKGCYVDLDDRNENRYRATWTFPGTLINLKSGLHKYNFKEEDVGKYDFHDDKFCLPEKGAVSVNKEWMMHYYNKLYREGPSTETTKDGGVKVIKNEYCEKNCPTSYKFLDTSYDTYDKESFENKGMIDWNIKASTRNFGYFGWNFDILCFYGLVVDSDKISSNPDGSFDSTPSSNCATACNSSPNNYRIRAVDFDNIFPESDGSPLVNKDATGRTPGFNWSIHADTSELIDSGKKDVNGNVIYKNANNPSFAQNPENYVKYLQHYSEESSSVYNDELLDYEFDLSTSDLRQLRKEVDNGHNVLDYKGKFSVDNGVSRYVSSLIHDTLATGNNRIPKASASENAKNTNSAIRCNNMENYSSTECVKFTEGGKKINE